MIRLKKTGVKGGSGKMSFQMTMKGIVTTYQFIGKPEELQPLDTKHGSMTWTQNRRLRLTYFVFVG